MPPVPAAPTPARSVRASWRELRAAATTGGARDRVAALTTWWKATRVARAQRRFSVAQGGLLCGGLAYTALFSLFASLTIGYTAFMAVLGSRKDLRDRLLDTIDQYVPGLIDTGHGGAIDPDQLLLSGVTSVAGVIAVAVLLWSAIAFMGSLRAAVRTMFGLQLAPQNMVLGKLRDLAAFVVLGAAVIASSATSILATRAASWATRTLGGGDGVRGLFTAGGLVAAAVVDALVVLYVVRVHAGARPRRRDLVVGVVAAAVVLGALRVLGTAVVAGSATRNVLLASFAALVTVLLLVNFVARVLLLACAWMADPHPDDVYPPTDDTRRARRRRARGAPTDDQASRAARRPTAPQVREGRPSGVRRVRTRG